MPPQDNTDIQASVRRSASPSVSTFSLDDDLNSSPPDRDSTQRLTQTENGQFVAPQTNLEQRADTEGLRARRSAESDSGAQSHLDELFQGCGDGPESSLLSLLSISPSAREGAIEGSDSFRLRTLQTNGQKTNLPSKTKFYGGSPPNRRPRSHWWWWEIAAVAFSIACMFAAAVLLANINNTRLSTWSFYFQPNTVISILTTLAKSAMLFSVSTCLSQLKWRHFQTRPAGRPLNHLDDFDDASRGPLGSLLMLGNHRLAAFIPSILAFITVASLAMDPMAQQVLKLPRKDFPLQSISAGIGRASSYKSYLEGHNLNSQSGVDPENYLMPLVQKAELFATIVGTEPDPQFNCPSPATTCSWDTFSSLAVCGTFSNLTDTASKDCTTLYHPSPGSISYPPNVTVDKFVNVTCKLSVLDMRRNPLTMAWYTGRTNAEELPGGWNESFGHVPLDCAYYDLLDATVQGPWRDSGDSDDEMPYNDQLSALYAKLYVARTLDHEILYNISDVRDYTNAMWQLPMRTEFLRASWNFCEQVYSDVRVDLGVLSVGNVTMNPLTLVASNSSYTYHSNASGLDYEVADIIGWEALALQNLFNLHLGYYPTPSGSSWTYTPWDSRSLLCQNEGIEDISIPWPSSLPDLQKYLSIYLRYADIEALTKNLATTLTARIRSNTTGGNVNLTMFPGQAFVNEAYVVVQWPWIILPITETVLAAATLAITIVLTRQQALLKGSTVSLLMHQIDGWGPEETRVQRLDTSEQLRDRAKKMVVRLDEGRDGEMMFKR